MTVGRWVHCNFCRQTYIASEGDRCSLCGKSGGLVMSSPTSVQNPDRATWAPGAEPDPATSCAAVVCLVLLGMVLGAGVGAWLAWGPGEGGCGLGPALYFLVLSGIGAFIGAIIGAIGSVIVLGLTSRGPGQGQDRAD